MISPSGKHSEQHFTHSQIVRDLVIGMSDGLTVPFALAAGLSGATGSNHMVIVAGLAEIAAGAIAMSLGGYLAAQSDMTHYQSELEREQREIRDLPEVEKAEVVDLLKEFEVPEPLGRDVAEALSHNPSRWASFMMRFELGLEEPYPQRAKMSALTIGSAYILGGLIPLSPYFAFPKSEDALFVSVGFTLTALAVFGWLKGYFMGIKALKSAGQTLTIGGLAAASAYLLARLIR